MNLLETVLDAEIPTPELLSLPEAFTAIVLLATVSDSYLTEEQERSLFSALSRSKLLRNYSQDAIHKVLNRTLDILWRDGFNALFNLAKESLPLELREAAFALSADLVWGEGLITDEEKNFLNDFYQALGISFDIATPILQTMLIKNQG
ncbi:tellurite resistance TerB family protein [Nostoc sp. UHCC 0870]|uniref:tellurite resistance TerB family protein n=1 Tax=Nostoc sp. UHCC 0870 TaxID=2914041 RepID=UPI001EDE494B|nr:tellurite resistance TerB family protein [Nostoc sp. UHCC 0870]UKO96159.1 tellurite resistance TerB family protein [Nostoc sp. UHCC 0870]